MSKKGYVDVYVRNGLTVYNVSSFKCIRDMLNASVNFITELAKVDKLPYVIYVEEADLLELNKNLMGLNKCRDIFIYLSSHRDAVPVAKIGNISDNHEKVESSTDNKEKSSLQIVK